MRFFSELKRRNVVRFGAAYLVIAWLLLQIADTLVPALHLPDWVVTAVALFLIIGFPLALVFAWAFEITPEGVRRESDIEPATSAARSSGRKLDFLIIGGLMVALGYFAYDKLFLDPKRDAVLVENTKQAVQEQAANAAESQKSIAVLPFANMSTDPEQEYFADGLAEELLNLLAGIPELRVAARTSSFSFKDENSDIRTIGKKLNVSTFWRAVCARQGIPCVSPRSSSKPTAAITCGPSDTIASSRTFSPFRTRSPPQWLTRSGSACSAKFPRQRRLTRKPMHSICRVITFGSVGPRKGWKKQSMPFNLR